MDTSIEIPDAPQHYLNLLINNKLEPRHEYDVLNLLWGSAITALPNNVDLGTYTFEELINDKDLLLFELVRSIYMPFSYYFPLSSKVAQKLEKEETKFFNNLSDNPIELYKKLEKSDIFKEVVNPAPKNCYNQYKETVSKMLKFYNKIN